MRCMAVDDEPFALELIADEISKVPYLELCKTCSSPLEALEYVKHEPIDLLFLDVQMPLLKGTQFLRSLQKVPMVIFTTAYEEYALEGFELDVIDYLMKPIPFERFLKAVNKAYQQFCLHKTTVTATPLAQELFFFIHAEYKEIKIFFDDVLYVEGLKDYVKIYIQGQARPILTRLNLKAMESKLPPQQFCRIHNSFIISLSKIESSQKSQVFIKQHAIPVGDKYASEFRRRYTST
jgi:DNA-binding LytR/AlgR family response regulator